MFLSATHFPSPALTAQAFQGLSLQIAAVPRLGLWFWYDHWERQVPPSFVLGNLAPCCISPCLLSAHLQVPKSVFFSHYCPSSGDPGPSKECFLWGCERWQSFFLLSAKVSFCLSVLREKGGYGVRQSGNHELRNPGGGLALLSPGFFFWLSKL